MRMGFGLLGLLSYLRDVVLQNLFVGHVLLVQLLSLYLKIGQEPVPVKGTVTISNQGRTFWNHSPECESAKGQGKERTKDNGKLVLHESHDDRKIENTEQLIQDAYDIECIVGIAKMGIKL